MADSILHIKDAYYFDVPKTLWQYHYTSRDQVPQFLRDAHPNATPEEFNEALDGKILIPQPFGTLKNFYQRESGFCISKFMVIEFIIGVLLVLVFSRLAAKIRGGALPTGKLSQMLEVMVTFVRDEIAKPAIGGHDYERFVPLLWTMFFFILGCNLFGMLPWMGAPTSAFGVTLTLAVVTFLTVLGAGMVKFGPLGFWFNQVPHMKLPLLLQPLKLGIFVIEVGGMIIRHLILGVRLLANMVAGHLVLLALLGLAFTVEAAQSSSHWGLTAVISLVGSTLFSLLELMVAFLQAYIFTFLSALFIGAAVHHH